MPETDADLLHDFTQNHSQIAFSRLIERYSDLAFAAARRQIADPATAEDITQAAFLLLARKSASVKPDHLPVWLLTTTGLCPKQAIRTRIRRTYHEQEAAMTKPEIIPPGDPIDARASALPPLRHFRRRDVLRQRLRLNGGHAGTAFSPSLRPRLYHRVVGSIEGLSRKMLGVCRGWGGGGGAGGDLGCDAVRDWIARRGRGDGLLSLARGTVRVRPTFQEVPEYSAYSELFCLPPGTLAESQGGGRRIDGASQARAPAPKSAPKLFDRDMGGL